MVRFLDRQLIKETDTRNMVMSEYIQLSDRMLDDGREFFKRHLSRNTVDLQLLSVVNERHEVICYAYQDSEANRELRMVKELERNKNALQFHDIYPEIHEVIVYGCNELSYHFVQYLERQAVNVLVTGRYWGALGYESSENININGSGKMIICAEGTTPKTGNLYKDVMRSVSSEFECIDKIYEANVLQGRIKDTLCNFTGLVEKLRDRETVIIGTDTRAQDAYDLLYAHGINVICFAEMRTTVQRSLLGKNVVSIGEAICNCGNRIFIDVAGQNSALGTENVEYFDYYGYERNEQYFLLRDYTDIPYGNLIHVLKGKVVWLAGDERLCVILADYLKEIEQEDVSVNYIELSQYETVRETDIFCIVNLWYPDAVKMEHNPKAWSFREKLSARGIVSYTEYFSCTRAFVLIDLHRNRGKNKYSLMQLIPKGVLLGRIPAVSGNIFFRGILDGNPEILKWSYTRLNNNLFIYCIRLAEERAENILNTFKRMCNEELPFQFESEFICWDRFEKSAKALLSLKERFTSQELFMLFHIAYTAMLRGQDSVDVCQKVIYWEPHNFPREEIPFLARWLEDNRLNGQTIFMHRDNIVWMGSFYKFFREQPSAPIMIYAMSHNWGVDVDGISNCCWKEFHVRFEDIKLHPKEELVKICDRLEIPWSDTMIKTTLDGKACDYDGILDFDLKPVFNKYEEFFSEFDRFRLALVSSPYQKKYGYTYEDCMRFSRKELQEMFLKEFRFQQNLQFEQEKDREEYYFLTCQSLQWQLWEARKRRVLNNIEPEFEEVEFGSSVAVKNKKQGKTVRNLKELEKLVQYIRLQDQLVLYGIGRDCEGILGQLSDIERSKLAFSDLKAAYTKLFFHGKEVLDPKVLCGDYKDYKILVTSSLHYETMRCYLVDIGIDFDRIICNKSQLWGDEE